jgi:hypothetical protein
MRGAEYLSLDTLRDIWERLSDWTHKQVAAGTPLNELLETFEQRSEQFFSTTQKLAELMLASQFAAGKLSYGELPCGFDEDGPTSLDAETRQTYKAWDQANEQVDRIDRLFLHRMQFAIDTLDADDRARSDRLLATLNAMRQHCLLPLRELHLQQFGLHRGVSWSQDGNAPREILEIANAYQRSTDAALRGLVKALDNIDDPTAGDQRQTLGDAIIDRWGKLPDASVTIAADQLLGYCDSLLNEFWYLYFRLLGELCGLCLRQEKEQGITSLRITFGRP